MRLYCGVGVTEAVRSLQKSLRTLGSDLVVVQGPWRQQLPLLALHLGASGVMTETEVEWACAEEVAAVRDALVPDVPLHTWTAPLFSQFVDNFRGGCRGRGLGAFNWLSTTGGSEAELLRRRQMATCGGWAAVR